MNKGKIEFKGWLCSALIGICMALFSCQQIPTTYYSSWGIWTTVVGAFVLGCYLCYSNRVMLRDFVKNHPYQSFLSLLAALAINYMAWQGKGSICLSGITNPMAKIFLRRECYFISSIALAFIILLLLRPAQKIVREMFQSIESNERKLYFTFSVIYLVGIAFLYYHNAMWYKQYDIAAFGVDSGWCYYSVFPNLEYTDIRHPLMAEIMFPVYALANFVVKIIVPHQLQECILAVLMQFVLMQMVLLVGVMIRIISKRPEVFLLYSVSYPVMQYSLTLEKYQICVFFVVLYLYLLQREEQGSELSYAFAAGCMPTSGIILIAELFQKRSYFKSWIFRFARIAATGVSVLILLGRSYMLNVVDTYQEIHDMHAWYGGEPPTVKEKFFAVLHMIQGSFVALSSEMDHWEGLYEKTGVLCALIVMVVVIGAILSFKESFTKMTIIWAVFPFILFIPLNWSPNETPLFSLMFSWAYIYLFSKAIDLFSERFHWNRRAIYYTMVVILALVNMVEMMDINQFLITYSTL